MTIECCPSRPRGGASTFTSITDDRGRYPIEAGILYEDDRVELIEGEVSSIFSSVFPRPGRHSLAIGCDGIFLTNASITWGSDPSSEA